MAVRWLLTLVLLTHLLALAWSPTPIAAKPLPSITNLVALARNFANDPARHGGVPLADRLAVIMHSMHSGTSVEAAIADKETSLHKSITLLLQNIGPHTPLDIYIFVPEAQAPADPGAHALTSLSPNIAVMPVLADQWHPHPHPHQREGGVQGAELVEEDRGAVGQWRLEVQFTFGAMMGYEYVLQFDENSYILAPYPHNIVERLRASNALMGGHTISKDLPHMFNGLPELARSFIVMHGSEHAAIYDKIIPPVPRWDVSSALYRHCNPSSIMGVNTKLDGVNGFDNSYIGGSLLVMKSQLWLRPLVQDWVQFCLLSGGAYKYRWAEQAIQAFVWLMFVEDHQFVQFSDIQHSHRKPT